jgi:Na+/H+-dicarboxylate symporter
MLLGVLVGLALGPATGWVDPDIARLIVSWLALPGVLFLALIQMIVVALVFASVVRGLAQSEYTDQLRSLGIGGSMFFIATTAISTALGLVLGLVIRRGSYLDSEASRASPTCVIEKALPRSSTTAGARISSRRARSGVAIGVAAPAAHPDDHLRDRPGSVAATGRKRYRRQ